MPARWNSGTDFPQAGKGDRANRGFGTQSMPLCARNYHVSLACPAGGELFSLDTILAPV